MKKKGKNFDLALFLILLAIGTTISVAPLSVMAQMGMGPSSASMGNNMGMDNDNYMGMGHGRAYDMWQQGQQVRGAYGMHGMGFMHQMGAAYGQFVTFEVGDNGDITDYGINGFTFFDTVAFNFDAGEVTTSTSGPVTFISGNTALVRLHDNPSGVLNVFAYDDITVEFNLANEVTATQEGEYILINSGGAIGYLLGVGDVSFSIHGSTVTVNAEANSIVVFRSSPMNMPAFGYMHNYNLGITQNRVGMEVALGSNQTYDFVNFSRSMHMEVQDWQSDRIRIIVDSAEEEGSIVSINLDNTSLRLGPGTMLGLHFDEMPLNCLDDPEIVLNATGTTPYCWISEIQDWQRTQCLMYIPNFSIHTIDFLVEEAGQETPTATSTTTTTTTTEPTAPTPTTTTTTVETTETPGFELITAITALSTVFLLVRRNGT